MARAASELEAAAVLDTESNAQAGHGDRADGNDNEEAAGLLVKTSKTVSQVGEEFEQFLGRRVETGSEGPEIGRQLLDSASSSARTDDGGHEGGEGGRGNDDATEASWETLEAGEAPSVVKALRSLHMLQAQIANGPRWDLEGYVSAVDELLAVQQTLEEHRCAPGLLAAEALVETAVRHLEEELEDALTKHSKPLDSSQLRELALVDAAAVVARAPTPPSTPGSSSPGPESPELALRKWLMVGAYPFLHKMATRMHAAGAAQRCSAKYRKVRASALKKTVKNLQAKEASPSHLASASWPELEDHIKTWIRDFSVLGKVLLLGEAALCSCVLEDLGAAREECLEGIMRDSLLPQAVLQVLRRAKAISQERCLPERLFALLDMGNTVQTLGPRLVALCPSSERKALSEELDAIPDVLRRAVVATLLEFRKVLEDSQPLASSKPPRLRFPWRSQVSQADDVIPLDGGIHATTSYVVNYIRVYLVREGTPDYGGLLEELLSKETGEESSGKRTLESETRLLLGSLQKSLEARAASSHDAALRELFLMNNLDYVQKSMSDKDFLRLVLPEWESEDLVDKHAMAFQKATLGKVTKLLTEPITIILGPSPDGLQDCNRRLRRFNAAFEELALNQGSWVIPDEERRRRVRHDWAAALRDAYSNFLLPHKAYLSEVPSYRYSADRIGSMILDLFFLGHHI